MWKVTKNVDTDSYQDLTVAARLKDLAQYTWATTASEFENIFKAELETITKTHSFSATNMYEATHRNTNSLEIWKLNAKGDFKTKMFTLIFENK